VLAHRAFGGAQLMAPDRPDDRLMLLCDSSIAAIDSLTCRPMPSFGVFSTNTPPARPF
jgi:hypothetical protein